MDRITKLKILKWGCIRVARRKRRMIGSFFNPKSPPISNEKFEEIISGFENERVFVHVGLSDVKKAFSGNPYKFLLKRLSENFECIMAPGFTPSFRDSGIYHRQFSRPEYGMFSKLFQKDADYRTKDAIHSILVKGDYDFSKCDHHDSFGPTSCWHNLDTNNILCLNIGTQEFLTTQIHFIEVKNNLPYIEVPKHNGVIYTNRKKHIRIQQKNYTYNYDFPINTSPNWNKIRRFLKSKGTLKDFSVEGLNIYSFLAQDIRKELEKKLEDDPYYLVT